MCISIPMQSEKHDLSSMKLLLDLACYSVVLFNRLGLGIGLGLGLRCVPLGSEKVSRIQDHLDHGASKKPKNPFPEWIHRFL